MAPAVGPRQQHGLGAGSARLPGAASREVPSEDCSARVPPRSPTPACATEFNGIGDCPIRPEGSATTPGVWVSLAVQRCAVTGQQQGALSSPSGMSCPALCAPRASRLSSHPPSGTRVGGVSACAGRRGDPGPRRPGPQRPLGSVGGSAGQEQVREQLPAPGLGLHSLLREQYLLGDPNPQEGLRGPSWTPWTDSGPGSGRPSREVPSRKGASSCHRPRALPTAEFSDPHQESEGGPSPPAPSTLTDPV